MKPTLYMLVGLPGSGKSYYAKQLREQYNASIHSSDKIREELSGDINNQRINEKVFNTLHNRIKNDLIQGISCIYDATNVTYKLRKAFLDQLASIPCNKICCVIATPYEECLKQNLQRERNVPQQVIEKMYRKFDVPYYYEGWDDIHIEYLKEQYPTFYGSTFDFLDKVSDFNQNNVHHKETLGEHCKLAADYVLHHYTENKYSCPGSVIVESAFLHDCGKPFCKTFNDSKGNTTSDAHYYNHEHVGSYNSLFYEVTVDSKYKHYISVLIRWHMQMHFIDKQQHTEKKYKNMFGDMMWEDLSLLHKADKEAH